MSRRPLLLAAAGAAALLAVVVSLLVRGAGPAPPPAVYAASSLRDVLPSIAPSARFSFGGSGALRLQIERGAPAAVFASAAPGEAEALAAAGRCDPPVVFALNRLVLITPAADPGDVPDLAALAAGGRRLAVGAEGVPVGRYTRAVLRRLGRTDVLRVNTVSTERDAASITSKVALGSADAGIVYLTDWRSARDRLRRVELPAAGRAVARYAACAVRRGDASTAAGRALVARLTTRPARNALRRAGFALPEVP